MKLIVISIKDRAVDAFLQPQFVRAKGEALRGFTNLINNTQGREDNQFHQHPDDYDLYIVAEFDDQSGGFEPCAPTLLVRGKDVLTKSN